MRERKLWIRGAFDFKIITQQCYSWHENVFLWIFMSNLFMFFSIFCTRWIRRCSRVMRWFRSLGVTHFQWTLIRTSNSKRVIKTARRQIKIRQYRFHGRNSDVIYTNPKLIKLRVFGPLITNNDDYVRSFQWRPLFMTTK